MKDYSHIIYSKQIRYHIKEKQETEKQDSYDGAHPRDNPSKAIHIHQFRENALLKNR